MTNEIQLFAKVSDTGTLEGISQRKLKADLKNHFAGRSVEILIHRKKKHRSVQQNRYYWLIVTMLSEHTGFTREELHQILKQRFLKTEKVHEDTGAIYEYTRSTTELTTIEYEDYLESVRRFAAEDFQMTLPLPNEQLQFTN